MEQITSVKRDKFFIENEIPIKEYDMWRDDIWKDAPRISSPKDEWADMPKISPILSTRSSWNPPVNNSHRSKWNSPKNTIRSSWHPPTVLEEAQQLPIPIDDNTLSESMKATAGSSLLEVAGPSWAPRPGTSTPLELESLSWAEASESGWVTTDTDSPLSPDVHPKRGMSTMNSPFVLSNEYNPETQTPEWTTPEKASTPKDDLDSSPRTSTPVSDISGDSDPELKKDQYECFKVHLNASPKRMKIRGGVTYENETIIAGHINMKNMDPFSYTFEDYYLPNVNRCFLNLLLHGPTPLMCHEHYDPNNPNNYVANCRCIPVCNCRANIISNKNLPIGYKYNEDGIVVPSMPAMPPRTRRRDPACIYTEIV